MYFHIKLVKLVATFHVLIVIIHGNNIFLLIILVNPVQVLQKLNVKLVQVQTTVLLIPLQENALVMMGIMMMEMIIHFAHFVIMTGIYNFFLQFQ